MGSFFVLGTGELNAGLGTLGEIFSWIMTQVGSLVTTIASQPLLLLPVGIFCVGAIIGLAGRLIGR